MNDSLKKRLAEYMAVAGFVVANQNTADAQIIYHDVNPDSVFNNFNQLEYGFYDLNSDGVYDIGFSAKRTGQGIDEVNAFASPYNFFAGYPNNYGDQIGLFVNAQQSWIAFEFSTSWSGTTSIYQSGPWQSTDNMYFPVKLTGGGQVNYGWMRLDVNLPYTKLTVKDFAFNSVDGAIILAGDKGCTGVTVNPVITTGIGDTLISSGAVNYQWRLNGDTIPGATSQSFEALIDGEYSVVVTDANGCHVLSDAHHKGTCPIYNPTINSAGTFCYNSIVTLTVNPLPFGYVSHWVKDSVEVSVESDAEYSYHATADNEFNVIIENPINHCTDTSATLFVHVNPLPQIDSLYQHEDSLICLTNGNNYIYSWNYSGGSVFSSSDNFYLPTLSNSYHLAVTDSNGCIKHQYISYNACYYISNEIYASSSAIGCAVDSIQLTVPFYPDVTYSWGSVSKWITAAGTYSVIIIDPTGNCQVQPTIEIPEATVPAPPVIYQTGVTLYTGAYFRYQWFYDGVALPGDTLFFVVTNEPEKYSVVVFNEAGCSNSSVNLNAQTIYGQNDFNIVINSNAIWVVFKDDSLSGSDLRLFNISGQLINTKRVENLFESFDCRNLPSGIYILSLITKDETKNYKIIFE